jgi:aryl-alcohol dehydrogenase-like predicted oxidoreductase
MCLGTITFGGRGTWTAIGSLPQMQQIIDKIAVDAGINFIDTANVYSFGLSEQLTGKAIRDLGLKRYELVIATKVRGMMGEGPNDTGLSRKHIMQQVDESLQRLQTDYIDLYQIHGFDPLTPMEETTKLSTSVKKRKVRYSGCSNMPQGRSESIGYFCTKSSFKNCFFTGLLTMPVVIWSVELSRCCSIKNLI